jgi:hypothetical protein
VHPDVLELVSGEIASKYACLPLFTRREGDADVLYLGVEDPTDLAVIDEVSFRVGRRVRPVVVGPLELREALVNLYPGAETSPAPQPAAEPAAAAEVAGSRPGPPASADAEFAPIGPAASANAPAPGTRSAAPPEARSAGAQPAAAPVAYAPGRRPAADADTAPVLEPRAGAPGASRRAPELPTRDILRALTRLLIEKGVFTRAEFMEAVRSLPARDTRGGDEG